MAGIVEGADGAGDVGGFGLGELGEGAELGVDVAVKIYQAPGLLPIGKIRDFFCKRR